MPGGEGLPDSMTWAMWIAEYVVSTYIIVTTLVLAAFGINLRPTVVRAEDGLLALANGLWVSV